MANPVEELSHLPGFEELWSKVTGPQPTESDLTKLVARFREDRERWLQKDETRKSKKDDDEE